VLKVKPKLPVAGSEYLQMYSALSLKKPVEIRGDFKTIPTTLPGVHLTEHLPLLARQTDKFSIIRGHDPKNGSHGVADHLMMSGHNFNPAVPFPCFGSVVSKARGYRDGMGQPRSHSYQNRIGQRAGASEAGRTAPYPIGVPFRGMKAALFDENGKIILHANEPGVLGISGPQVMTGYWNDPEMTARVLRAVDGDVYYISGDYCVRDSQGVYSFVGRTDSEVKIRGRRINLNEVRNALMSCAGVGHVAVDGQDAEFTIDGCPLPERR